MSVNKVNKTTGETTIIAGSTLYADAPIGAISPFGGATAPLGWLLCQGQAVSRTDYSELFEVIGTAFGTGDGSTTFNLPDFRSQTPVGVDSRDTNLNAIGKTYGEKTHTLTIAEIPSHAHGLNSHTHSIPALSGTAASAGSHSHAMFKNTSSSTDLGGGAYPAAMGTFPNYPYRIQTTNSTPDITSSGSAGAHTHTVTTNASTTGAASGNTATNGSGNSHNIMQPSTAVNYIIKAKQVIIPADFEAAVDEKIADNIVDSITDGSMKAATSNAVYDLTQAYSYKVYPIADIGGSIAFYKHGKFVQVIIELGNGSDTMTYDTNLGGVPVITNLSDEFLPAHGVQALVLGRSQGSWNDATYYTYSLLISKSTKQVIIRGKSTNIANTTYVTGGTFYMTD